MKREEEHFRLKGRVFELKRIKLQNRKLSVDEQIEYDRLISRMKYLSHASCEDIKHILKEIGYIKW